MKRCSASLVFREIQKKNEILFLLVKLAKKLKLRSCQWEQIDYWWDCYLVKPFWKAICQDPEKLKVAYFLT